MRRTATGIAATSLAMSAALLGGCQVYLHDDALQKQTASAVTAYKEADVPGAMKATIAAQEKFNEQMLSTIVAEDAAARDREIAKQLESGDGAALRTLIEGRLKELGVLVQPSQEKDWTDRLVALDLLRTQHAGNTRIVNLMARLYRDAGGTEFKKCDQDWKRPASGDDAKLVAAAGALEQACGALLPIAKKLDEHIKDFDQRVCKSNPGSMLADACQQIEDADKSIAADEEDAETAKRNLETAKKALASEIEAGTTGDRIKEKLEAFKAELDRVDQLVAELGVSNFKPSAALAAIEFRETNLCDVLLAGVGTSCSGGKVDANAKKINESVIGLISGLSQVVGPPPKTDALSIALTYQSGLQGAVQASLEGRRAQRVLLQTWQNALVQEVEYLVQARSQIDNPDAKLIKTACSENTLSAAPRARNCHNRVALANALTAYNLSWADGRTAARIAYTRITMRITLTNLRVAQATAASRDSMLTTALAGLDAFGQGGVSTQTIAELLQALGIAAVAYGVN